MASVKRFTYLVLFVLLSAVIAAADNSGGLDFNITDWNTGELEYGILVEQSVEVVNNTDDHVTIDLISTCSCMTTDIESLEVSPGSSGVFTIIFDSSDDQGEFEKLLIIQTDSDFMPKGFFVVTGSVKVSDKVTEVPEAGVSSESGTENSNIAVVDKTIAGLFYYYTPGCKSCNRFLKDADLPIERRDITEAVYYEELQNRLDALNISLQEVPVLISGSTVFQGEEAVKAGYTAIREGRVTEEAGVESTSEKRGAGVINLSLLAVLAAGLLDGVNPCAFTTLIFLLSALSVAGRSRRETLVIGLFFTVTVFVTYYLIGVGFFKIIRIADSFELISRIIRWLLFAVLIVFAGLSFYDYGKIRVGKTSEILLQLPDGVKRRMHSSIRSYSKSAALAGSSIVMGFLISIFELGCTGQIYFPTITYIIQTGEASTGYFFLALYNLAFILPLVIVFIVVFLGVTSKKITKMFQANLGIIKVLTGLLFIGFAILMLVL